VSVTQKSFRLNDFAIERQRTTSRGTKNRVSIEIKSEPLQINLDETALGAPVAVAIKKVIQQQIEGIAETASSGTLLTRKYATNAYGRSEPWAMKRYAGGRTGPKQPGKSAALFNDSGRLAEGLAVRANPKEGAFTINVPANRFDESTFKSRALFLAMLERFGQLVPAVGQPETVLDDPRVQRAIREGMEKVMYQKVQQGSAAALEVAKEGLELVRGLVDLGEIIEGE
jgi:hypothetical protein